MIYYFSGTGNSRLLAGDLAEILADEARDTAPYLRQPERRLPDLSGEERIVIVSPVYAWRLPRAVEAFIRKAAFGSRIPLYFLLNCGSEIGDACRYIETFCLEQKLNYQGTASVKMPENYLILFPTPPPEEARKQFAEARLALVDIAGRLKRGERLQPDPRTLKHKSFSHIINPLFYRFHVKAKDFVSGPSCVSCGLCARACPLGNIRLKDGRPSWGSRCTHCMACISYCPAEAIDYKNVLSKRRIYTAEKVLGLLPPDFGAEEDGLES